MALPAQATPLTGRATEVERAGDVAFEVPPHGVVSFGAVTVNGVPTGLNATCRF